VHGLKNLSGDLENREEIMAGRRMSRLRDVLGSRTGAILAVVVLCSLLLSGCGDIGDIFADLFHLNGNGNGDAEAQEGERLIQTFAISPGTFELRPDSMPQITVRDGSIEYVLRSNAAIEFDPDPSFGQLQEGDMVIEWPEAGMVTVIRVQ
jgi:hypothetical protein